MAVHCLDYCLIFQIYKNNGRFKEIVSLKNSTYFYSVFHRFREAKFGNDGSILS